LWHGKINNQHAHIVYGEESTRVFNTAYAEYGSMGVLNNIVKVIILVVLEVDITFNRNNSNNINNNNNNDDRSHLQYLKSDSP
jgi:citrate lyase alpha subunit